MLKPVFAIALLSFAVSACTEATRVEDDPLASQATSDNPTGRTERPAIDPAEKPIRIGLGGPRFDACQAVGRVQGLRGRQLDVRVAPFDSARARATIAQDQQVWICTRSHDQQWLGIVYDDGAPAADEGSQEGEEEAAASAPAKGPGDCGVSSPVRSKRNYDGPCKSGWVESNYVRLVAG